MQWSYHIAEQVILVGLIHCSLNTSLVVCFIHITFYPFRSPVSAALLQNSLWLVEIPVPWILSCQRTT